MLRKFLILLFVTSSAYAVKNAGVLPYAYKDGKAYFLFGLENRSWDSGSWTKNARSKWVWSDFGGKCDVEDTTNATKYSTDQATLCAAREGTEETRYVFGNKLPLNSKLTNKSQEYDNSVRYLIKGVTGSFPVDSFYEEFFVNVYYIDAPLINKSPSVPSDEKTEWKWILVDDVLKALEKTQDGFFRFQFTHSKTNKIFPYLAMTLKRSDVQYFIKNIILAGETPVQPKDNLQDLLSSITNLNNELTQLTQQLQAFG